jgi:hypothetical protein
MSLYLCVFDGEREVDGVEVGPYAAFNAFREAVAAAGASCPVLLGHSDCDGAWDLPECAALLAELDAAAEALRSLPPGAFTDVEGAPLAGRLRELAGTALATGRPILFQ